ITGGWNPASISAICFANVLSAKTGPRRGPVWLKPRVTTTCSPYDLKYWYASLSWATLLTAYGDNGRSGFVSFIGTSSGWTRPYSSLDPATCTRVCVSCRRTDSRTFTCDWMLMWRVDEGSSKLSCTNDCAAR